MTAPRSIPPRLRLLGRAACALLLGAAVLLAPPDAAAKSKKKAKKEDEEKTFSLPIPIGHRAEGIKLPDYDPSGRLQMNFEIGSALRVDETHLQLSDLRIETFNETGAPEMRIIMPASVLDLKTRIVTSEEPVVIEREDFEVKGKNMTFDTRTRRGKFSGPVRMLIYNRDDLNASTNAKTDE